MTSFRDFLAAERTGILTLVFILIAAGGVVNWVLWMFGWGRFRGTVKADSKIRYVVSDFFVKIINEFRDLLALAMVALFGVALFAAMWPGLQGRAVQELKDGVQAVGATLGGLIGSIIGYYFGESAGKRKSLTPKNVLTLPGPAEQALEPEAAESADIKQPQKPSEGA